MTSLSLSGQTRNTSLWHVPQGPGVRYFIRVRLNQQAWSTVEQSQHSSANSQLDSWQQLRPEPHLLALLCQGVRAVISQNEEISEELREEGERYQETYLHYPDRGPEAAGFSQYPGDARAALAPFLAARHLPEGSFKWILFGDGESLCRHFELAVPPSQPSQTTRMSFGCLHR